MSTDNVTAEKQFLIYHGRLRDELNTAYTHYEIAKSLGEFSHTHRSEFIEAITFFQVTINANLFATVMSVSRFIYSTRKSLNLDVLFEFIRNNKGLFSAAAYKKRLLDKGMDSEDCEHWVKLHTDITVEMVDEDKAKLESLPTDNLLIWRHKKLAHIEKGPALNNIDIMKENPVTVKEIDDILVTLDEILNRYSIAYDGTQWRIGLPPVKHQIEYLMDAIKLYRQHNK